MSLPDHLARLQRDLLASPVRISAYRELPFAIALYRGDQERLFRKEIARLAGGLEAAGKRVTWVSLADLFWEAIDESYGLAEFVEQERMEGFAKVQESIGRTLTDPEFTALPDRLAGRLSGLDPAQDVAIVVRAGALAPSLYQISTLLDEMQGRTQVPTILCYPGGLEGTTGLMFMVPFIEKVPMGNYRVEIYREA